MRQSPFVQKFPPDGARPGNKSEKTRKAQASLEEFRHIVALFRNSRIDDGVKWHGPPLALSKLLRGDVLVVIRSILDHSELQGKSYLGSRKPHAWGVIHGLSHRFDQRLNFLAGDFSRGQGACLLAQYRMPGLYDLEFHTNLDSCAPRRSARRFGNLNYQRGFSRRHRQIRSKFSKAVSVSCACVPDRPTRCLQSVRAARYTRWPAAR